VAISERLGDQAGFADSYHRLSRIAELRGEYGPAEEHYRRALAIKERLGDQASLATTRGQLGAFYTERGRSDQAVPYTLAALAFFALAALASFAQAGSPSVDFCVRWLREQRRALRDDRFTKILVRHVEPGGIAAMLSLTRPETGSTSP
jgi:hypothetical protein